MNATRRLIAALDHRGTRVVLGRLATQRARRSIPGATVAFRGGMWTHTVGDYVFVDSPRFGYFGNLAEDWPAELTNLERLPAENWFHLYHPVQGDTIVDVGAGKGEDAVAFSRAVGPTGRVLAIEAFPTTYEALRLFCLLNGLSNVTPVNAAITDSRKTVKLSSEADWQANSIVGGAHSGPAMSGVSLDDLLVQHDVKRIGLLKMNIEGAESEAVRGMSKALAMSRVVCISCHDFRADRGEGKFFRTKAIVEGAIRTAGFRIVQRESSRPWIADQVNGIRN
jgi:FkbM family methyltransferase